MRFRHLHDPADHACWGLAKAARGIGLALALGLSLTFGTTSATALEAGDEPPPSSDPSRGKGGGSAPRGTPAKPRPTEGAADVGAESNLHEVLTLAQDRLAKLKPELDELIAARIHEIKEIEAKLPTVNDPELRARKDIVSAERDAGVQRLGHLRDAVQAYQEAVDADQDRQHSIEALADLQHGIDEGSLSFVQADIDATGKEISQAQNTDETLAAASQVTKERCNAVEEKLAEAKAARWDLLEAHRVALTGQLAASDRKRGALKARIELLTVRLQAAREAVGNSSEAEPPESAPSPPSDEGHKAEELRLKQLLADRLSKQARDDLEEAQERLTALRQLRDAEADAPAHLASDLDYWQRRLEFAQRKRQLADLRSHIAAEEEKLPNLERRLSEATAEKEAIEKVGAGSLLSMPAPRVGELRSNAEDSRQAAAQLRDRESEERDKVPLLAQLLAALDAQEVAIIAHVERTFYFDHFQRMTRLLDAERIQVRQLISEQKVLVYALSEQAREHELLAKTQDLSADILHPPLRQWVEEHINEIRALAMLLAALGATWLLSLLGRLVILVVTVVTRWIAPRLSIQRFRTVQGFALSIMKVFLWLVVMVAVLKEFGIDPAKSTGAIGLIGLILAGMFQQIVVDFVKGIDIIIGRHYHVGDFIEVDGKFGHVLDFNAKYTRIRTPSGQQISIPNSLCIPSRRFPEGFVDNYVDIGLTRGEDALKAREALAGVCREINERIEVIRDEPRYLEEFVGADGKSRVLRYRVRVLPGSDWVVKDYFIPYAKGALADVEIALIGEPTTLFMNKVPRFRKLFSRELSEAEIVEEAVELPPDEPGSHPDGVAVQAAPRE